MHHLPDDTILGGCFGQVAMQTPPSSYPISNSQEVPLTCPSHKIYGCPLRLLYIGLPLTDALLGCMGIWAAHHMSIKLELVFMDDAHNRP